MAGVAGYNALAYFQARYPARSSAFGQQDNWRLDRAGDRGLQRRRPLAIGGPGLEQYRFASVLDLAGNCALELRARSGDGLAH